MHQYESSLHVIVGKFRNTASIIIIDIQISKYYLDPHCKFFTNSLKIYFFFANNSLDI